MNLPPSSSNASSGPKFIVILLLVGVAGLGAWAFSLKQDLAAANTEIAALRKNVNGATASKGDVPRLQARVAELESRLAAVPAPATSAPTEEAAPAAKAANPMVAVAQMMATNPAMKAIVARNQRQAIETQMAELFGALQLTPEQQSRFVDILAERQAAATEANLKLASGNLSVDERRALAQEMQQANLTTLAAVRDLLGDENKVALFRQYTEQQTERTQVNALKSMLASTPAPLSPEQSGALTTLMYEERKGFVFTKNPEAAGGDPVAALNSQTVETNLQEQEQLDARIATRAASLLSPEQLAALRKTQDAKLKASRAQLEMSRQLLGGQSAGR